MGHRQEPESERRQPRAPPKEVPERALALVPWDRWRSGLFALVLRTILMCLVVWFHSRVEHLRIQGRGPLVQMRFCISSLSLPSHPGLQGAALADTGHRLVRVSLAGCCAGFFRLFEQVTERDQDLHVQK